MIEHYVRLVSLPLTVEGVTLPNDDSSFDIYINSRLSPEKQQAALQHELRHLECEHFYLDLPVSRMERQADGEAVNVVLHPPGGTIPCFSSETALARWLTSLSSQLHISLD